MKKLLILTLFSLLLVNCTKQDNKEVANTNILTNEIGWLLQDWTVTGTDLNGDRFVFDQYNQLNDCTKRDVLVYNVNNTFIQNSTCSDEVMSGKWYFKNEQLTIINKNTEYIIKFEHINSFQIIQKYKTIHRLYGEVVNKQIYIPNIKR